MASTSTSTESTPSHRHGTHAPVILKEPYYPPSTYQTFGVGIDPPSPVHPFSIADSAVAFVKEQLQIDDASTIRFRESFSSDVAHHAVLDQVHKQIPFSNVSINVSFNHRNKVIAFGSSYVKLDPYRIIDPTPRNAEAKEFADNYAKTLNGKCLDHPPKHGYLAMENSSAVFTHIFYIRGEIEGISTTLEAFVDAHSEPVVKLVSTRKLTLHASYRVLPIQKQHPLPPNVGFEDLVDPADPIASPHAWHSTGGVDSTNTSGNNAIVSKVAHPDDDITAQSAAGLTFHYPQDPNVDPTIGPNVDAARVNAFYLVNTMHDIAYRYGFDEQYNFQERNFGNGGGAGARGRLRVKVQVRKGLSPYGAFDPIFFYTSDPPLLEILYCDAAFPFRDGCFANDLIIHEFTHGITVAMSGSRILSGQEAEGLSEGLSDVMAWWISRTEANVQGPYMFGVYVRPDRPTTGIRNNAYSTDVLVNNLRYSSLGGIDPALIHGVGEVWATMLFKVHADLVAARGFSANARTNPNGTGGNIIFLRLFMDSLSLLPPGPTFVTARDAWLQADETRYGGDHKKILWRAFASRGLGFAAVAHNRVDSFTLPPE